ncbi:secreted protein [Rhodopirellula maiorica SM1]|uniref:Secreted protein n=1 Tax=Rhodopirellula maiorica SM1 TaxID=1265738 RepID=M5S4U8_9BACT|nr:hypothetical protein [Rhodopirellula maiorica]EMI22667.1 secreted protein [Rhodopirellula maiorica SM1]
MKQVFLFSLLLFAMICGCGESGPRVIERPEMTPEEAAAVEAEYERSMTTDA